MFAKGIYRCVRLVLVFSLCVTTVSFIVMLRQTNLTVSLSKHGLRIVTVNDLAQSKTRSIPKEDMSATNKGSGNEFDIKGPNSNHSRGISGTKTTKYKKIQGFATNIKKRNDTRTNHPEATENLKDQTIELKASRNTIQKSVIILAYMHTGSTYIASLINNHPGTFYEFEPLRIILELSRKKSRIHYLNGSTRHLHGDVVDTDVGAETVNNIATCNHDKLDIATLTHISRRGYQNKDSSEFMSCMFPKKAVHARRKWSVAEMNKHSFQHEDNPNIFQEKRRNFLINRRELISKLGHNTPNIQHKVTQHRTMKDHVKDSNYSALKDRTTSCLPLLVNKCRKADIVLTKYIRMTIDIAQRVLKENNDVHIIHLVRDPRAMMDSQLRKNDLNVKRLKNFIRRTQYMCSRMRDDLYLAKSLKELYPNRILTLRYEDLIDNPLETGKRIFGFIEVPFTENDRGYILKTSIELRKNSTYKANVWRHHITQHHLNIVNSHCDNLYKVLDYVPFKGIFDVRNLDKADHVKHFKSESVGQ